MDRLNYHHLLYFWMVAREGGLVPAGKVLHLSHPTLSAQIRALEAELGEKLFEKRGRKLALTEIGQVAYRYADDIFGLGRELVDTVRGRGQGQASRLRVGVADVVPKLVVRGMLRAVMNADASVRLLCSEGRTEQLLRDLADHRLDVVIADSPVPASAPVKAYHHLLGETGITLFAADSLARRCRRHFPTSLTGMPFLLPLPSSTLRRGLDSWFDRHGITPRVVGEFEDSALLKVFGGDGLGIFPAPTAVADEVAAQYDVAVVGEVPDVRERFYAITAERKLKHPAVVAIHMVARDEIFARR